MTLKHKQKIKNNGKPKKQKKMVIFYFGSGNQITIHSTNKITPPPKLGNESS
jgi:hypothetical protein